MDTAEEAKRKFWTSGEFWRAIFTLIVVMGVPALLWGGSMNSRMESVEQQQRSARVEIREDFREVNRKLDALMEKIK